jgi:hypothetical protein
MSSVGAIFFGIESAHPIKFCDGSDYVVVSELLRFQAVVNQNPIDISSQWLIGGLVQSLSALPERVGRFLRYDNSLDILKA